MVSYLRVVAFVFPTHYCIRYCIYLTALFAGRLGMNARSMAGGIRACQYLLRILSLDGILHLWLVLVLTYFVYFERVPVRISACKFALMLLRQ